MAEPTPLDQFKLAMRRLPGAVTVVATTGGDGERRGVTATAVCSLSLEPPSVLACINQKTWVGSIVPVSRCFSVNLLSADQEDVARAFAGMSGLAAADRFSVGDWTIGATGAPVLTGSVASFDCSLEQAVEWTTHHILIGRVVSTVVSDRHPAPLIYANGAFAGLAA